MAESNKKKSLIDPIYQKYARSLVRTLASTDFYEFFMDMIGKAENEFQFSNRRSQKIVDTRWTDAVDASLSGFQRIISNPRNIIREEEIIVNVAQAKHAGQDVVQHLACHGNLVSYYDAETHEVRPDKLMQKVRYDSDDIYENRFVYTVLEAAHHFVRIRHEALFEVMGDEFGAKLKMQSDLECAEETIHFDMFMHVKTNENTLDIDEKSGDVLATVSRLYRVLTMFMNTPFAQQMARLPRVKGAIVKTNVLKKNPDYKAVLKLWEFLGQYDEVGYIIKVTEQNPVITEEFQRDLFHNIMYQYIVLKGYLEAEEHRRVPAPVKQRKRTLKPKFIREIVEELTEDYDLPDVEIRKVLIEELTKEQLMKEEAEERRRLVAEQEQRRKEEQQRLREEKEREKERLREEREAEQARIRREKEAEEERLRLQQLEQENEDRRFEVACRRELEKFERQLPDQLEARENEKNKRSGTKRSDFENAVEEMQAAEKHRLSRAERERRRLQEEQERMAAARLEAERLRAEQERVASAEQQEQDRRAVAPYLFVLKGFAVELANGLQERTVYLNEVRADRERFEEQRRARRQSRAGG